MVACTVGDDYHISVNMRGGPEKWQVTGWLQVVDLQKVHEGDYTCVAQNEHGVDRATARINVVAPGEGNKILVDSTKYRTRTANELFSVEHRFQPYEF